MSSYLDNLNKQQYDAVTSNDKYLRIIAGAGSGKTRVLTCRIVYLIKELNANPSSILAITFTNKVANEMKERAIKLLNEENIVINRSELLIKTFHSFCCYFLRREIASNLNFSNNFIVLDEVDQKEFIKQSAVSLGFEKKDEIINKAVNFIQKWKGKGYYPNNKNIDTKFVGGDDILKIFEVYEGLKNANYALDFDDLILKTIQILKINDKVRHKWQERLKNILIDEFQDTDDVQYELLNLLVGENSTLYVVGDPDQTIYTWRGANQDIILNLERDFPGLKTIILNQNYRSSKKILDVSNNLIAHNSLRFKKDLVTQNEEGADIELFNGFSRNEEADFVISNIIKLKSENPDFTYNDVAILYRSNYMSNAIEKKMFLNKIPYVLYGSTKYYQRLEIKLMIAYFRLLLNPNDNISYLKIINAPRRKIGENTISLLQEECNRHKLSIYQYIEDISNYNDTKLRFTTIIALQTLNSIIKETNSILSSNNSDIVLTLKNYIEKIGLLSYIEDLENGEDRIENALSLYDDLANFLKESDDNTFGEYLENVALASAQDDVKDGDKVKLMTIHTAKGLEFKYVFVIFLNQDCFPNARSIIESPKTGIEEERRLCYVAFTRAKEKLFLSCNKEYSYVSGKDGVPSIFFKEAGLKFKKDVLFNNKRYETFNRINYSEREKSSIVDMINKMNKKDVLVDYKVGDKVLHRSFGEGKVVNILDDILTIDFESQGKKNILKTFKGLEKIN